MINVKYAVQNSGFRFVSGLSSLLPTALLCFSASVHSNSPPDTNFRDLDGNIHTIEAVYDVANNITWLADTNLGLTQTFGIERGDLSDYYSLRISELGLMTQDTAAQYIDLMNSSNYLGYGQWRLPEYSGAPDTDCSEQSNNGMVVFGTGCTGTEVARFNRDVFTLGSVDVAVLKNLDQTARWVGSIGPSGGLYYFQFGGEGNLDFCPGGDGICNTGFVWPVLDGDVGTVVTPICDDPNGDGWGWNGFSSCKTEPTTTTTGECIDTIPVNDGWGWNGVESCRLSTGGEGRCQSYGHYPWGWNNTTQTSCRLDKGKVVTTGDCIDTVPVNDGWGWNGVTSCRLPAAGEGVCLNYGDFPWGWNNTTQASCRLD